MGDGRRTTGCTASRGCEWLKRAFTPPARGRGGRACRLAIQDAGTGPAQRWDFKGLVSIEPLISEGRGPFRERVRSRRGFARFVAVRIDGLRSLHKGKCFQPPPPSSSRRFTRFSLQAHWSGSLEADRLNSPSETDSNFRWRSDRTGGGEGRFLRTKRSGARSKRGGTELFRTRQYRSRLTELLTRRGGVRASYGRSRARGAIVGIRGPRRADASRGCGRSAAIGSGSS